MSERFSDDEWEAIFGPVRHLRSESGPVTLGGQYLELIRRVEDLPENQSGRDKTWVERSLREYREHCARARSRSS